VLGLVNKVFSMPRRPLDFSVFFCFSCIFCVPLFRGHTRTLPDPKAESLALRLASLSCGQPRSHHFFNTDYLPLSCVPSRKPPSIISEKLFTWTTNSRTLAKYTEEYMYFNVILFYINLRDGIEVKIGLNFHLVSLY
jgi:hypothetical protein